MKNFRTIAMMLTMAFYLWFPFSMIFQQERTLVKGTPFRFLMEPVDPRDPFRGSYLALHFMPPPLPADTSIEGGQRVFVTLRTDSLGFAHFDEVLPEAPSGEPYIQTRLLYHSEEGALVAVPENMQRYYLNEKLAPIAEEAYFRLLDASAEAPSAMPAVFTVVRIWKGRALIEEVFFEGKPLQEYLNGVQ